MKTSLGLLALVATCSIAARVEASGTTIFEDDFDDNAAGWTFESLTGNFSLSGSDVEYGYDYSAAGIPEAPNSAPGDAPAQGVRLRTNTGGLPTDQAAIYLEDPDFSGPYSVQVDMWLNWPFDPNGVGTTIHGGLHVGDAFEGDENANTPIQRGAGYIASTIGCVNCGHILLKNEFELDTFSGQYAVNDVGFGNQPGYDRTDVNTDPGAGPLFDLPALLPEVSFGDATGGVQTPVDETSPAGNAGFRWITITADVDPTAVGSGPNSADLGTASFTITNDVGESFTVGTVDNSQPDILDDDGDGDECDTSTGSEDICINLNNPFDGDVPVDLEGRISLVLIDFFAGAGADIDLSFALFDNLKVFTGGGPDLLADFNGDGVVDLLDLDILGQNFGGPGDPSTGDATGDGVVDLLDLDVLGQEFGEGSASAVPEPTAALLAGFAVCLCRTSRRR